MLCKQIGLLQRRCRVDSNKRRQQDDRAQTGTERTRKDPFFVGRSVYRRYECFLDYYYYIKTKDNQIYVVEEDGQICSMLQLNPYLLKIEESERPSAYIIAVATKEEYRGRGFMGNLLRQALNDMYTAKVPFTFLMPAAEAIYTPYDFRFIYSQRIGIQDISSNVASGKGTTVRNCTFTDAAVWNAEEMAAFFNSYFADVWQVHAIRDSSYYQTMIMEQQSERGGVRLIRENGDLKGIYAYAAEDGLEIREPLYLPDMKMPSSVRSASLPE